MREVTFFCHAGIGFVIISLYRLLKTFGLMFSMLYQFLLSSCLYKTGLLKYSKQYSRFEVNNPKEPKEGDNLEFNPFIVLNNP